MKKVLPKLLEFQCQLQILHWQTTSGYRHVAYGKIYEEFSESLDELVEIYNGNNGTVMLDGDENITIINAAAISDLRSYLNDIISLLFKDLRSKIKNQPDVLAIIDDMIGQINKLKYLLTQK